MSVYKNDNPVYFEESIKTLDNLGYAIKNKIHPKQAVVENIKVFKNQIKDLKPNE